MKIESCPNCGEPIIEGRLNCIKCGSMYPDVSERHLDWDPTEADGSNQD
jgi:ribosomal protein L32